MTDAQLDAHIANELDFHERCKLRPAAKEDRADASDDPDEEGR